MSSFVSDTVRPRTAIVELRTVTTREKTPGETDAAGNNKRTEEQEQQQCAAAADAGHRPCHFIRAK